MKIKIRSVAAALYSPASSVASRLALVPRRLRSSREPPAVTPVADLILTNGKVVTVEEGAPEAQAVAVRGDRIVAIGSSADIQKYSGAATKVIDLDGQLLIPGFTESHGHFTGIGQAELNLKLMPVQSWDEIVAMVAEAAKKAKPGEWIYGRGWHQEKWTSKPAENVEGFPLHKSLDAGVAQQSRPADTCQRTRELRQRQGDGALEHHAPDGESSRRRDPQGRVRAIPPGCCARPRPA